MLERLVNRETFFTSHSMQMQCHYSTDMQKSRQCKYFLGTVTSSTVNLTFVSHIPCTVYFESNFPFPYFPYVSHPREL